MRARRCRTFFTRQYRPVEPGYPDWHGPEDQPAIDPASVVAEQRIYLEDLMAAVKQAMDAGTHSPDKLRQTVKLPKYEGWQYYNEWLPMNIERIWAYYHMGW